MAKKATLPTAKVRPQNLYPFEFFDLKGLDTYSPDELIDPSRCVYGRNFRLYLPNSTTQRVAISKRNGTAFYSVPVGETVDQQITSTTGAADQSVGLTTWIAQKYTAGATGNLTKVDVRIKNAASATGPLIVAIYSDSSGPSTLLATSSIVSSTITSSYQYLSARFIEAPVQASGTSYWVVCYIQGNGSNTYSWSSTTSATTAKTSSDSGATWSSASFAMNLKTYISTSGEVLGVHRYYRSTAAPVQLFAHKTNVYTVNDSTGVTTSIKGSLSPSAVNYDFTTVNNKAYWVNGQDPPQVYNGATVAAVGGSPPVSNNVEVHANHLFLLQPNTNYLVFSDAGDYETFGVTSFIYIPSPNTADAVIKIVSVNGVLICFTRNTKFLLFGTALQNFVLKESPATKGAVSQTAVCKSEDSTYFVSSDYHVYATNGSTDTKLSSERVAAFLRNVASTATIKLYVADKKLFVAITPSGGNANTQRLIYDLTFSEWLNDEELYSGYGLQWNSQSDTGQQLIASSLVGALYYDNTGTSDLGKPIKFDWWSKYMSFGAPAAKHRVKRYYPFLAGQSGNYSVDCQIDINHQNSPSSNLVSVNAASHLFGDSGLIFGSTVNGGSGLTFGSNQLALSRLQVPGSSRLTQFRFVQAGVDEPVGIIGFSLYIQPKRPV